MRVTDSQVHVWAASRPDRPAESGAEPHLPPPFTVEHLSAAMDEAGVDRVVLVPPRWVDYVTGNDYSLDAARAQPHRFAVMGRLDPAHPDSPAALSTWLGRPGMKGLRLNLRWERLEDMEWLWPAAVRLGLPVAIHAARGAMPSLRPVVGRNPQLCLIIDHLGLPAAGPDPFADLDEVLALAKFPNVVVKLSGMTRYTKEPYPFRDLQQHIRRAYDAFGPQRLTWGSDFTWEVGRRPYREIVDLFREACDFLTPSDREWILDKTFARALRWDA